jgi:hypothetical protein
MNVSGMAFPSKRETRDMDVMEDVDEYPLVQVGKGAAIVKQVDFEISVESGSPTIKHASPAVPW